jgi:hypothetical protein
VFRSTFPTGLWSGAKKGKRQQSGILSFSDDESLRYSGWWDCQRPDYSSEDAAARFRPSENDNVHGSATARRWWPRSSPWCGTWRA